MAGRGLLILLLGIIAIAVVSFRSIYENSREAINNVSYYYLKQSAHNISQSGVNLALRQLADSSDWRVGYSNLSMFSGQLNVRLVDTTFEGSNVVKIESIGYTDLNVQSPDTMKSALSIAYVQPSGNPGFTPASVLAAVTTNNNVSTTGNLVVDGRDHDINGNLIDTAGTLGIWTTGTLDRGGNSKIGATGSGTDYAPAKTENDNIRLENQTYPGGYPSTPDSVLGGTANGYPPGTLKTLAQSGSNGSQYTTNPGTLTYPLSGVTYIELSPGGVWNPCNIDGDGILIVHNNTRDAVMKNLNFGIFRGLIIADDPVHIHTTIIGAIIGLTPSPSEGNCIGNGNGDVLYSREAINAATANTTGGGGSGSSSSNVVAWWD
ncbi:MAG: hypothetical protein A2V66_12460 [Ignavibacteria bacterium RBG_13_36_8]|nr:MAG: hypothetical protein A2V66_12460 [Ignavibacteria bacterium RBG_13_36_8]